MVSHHKYNSKGTSYPNHNSERGETGSRARAPPSPSMSRPAWNGALKKTSPPPYESPALLERSSRAKDPSEEDPGARPARLGADHQSDDAEKGSAEAALLKYGKRVAHGDARKHDKLSSLIRAVQCVPRPYPSPSSQPASPVVNSVFSPAASDSSSRSPSRAENKRSSSRPSARKRCAATARSVRG